MTQSLKRELEIQTILSLHHSQGGLIGLTRDYSRMDWKALAFFPKLKPLEIAKYGTNIICESSKDTHFLKIWRV